MTGAARGTARPPGSARSIARDASDYPAGLLDLRDAPPALYVLGTRALPAPARAVAIVGSRAASAYGRAMATRLAHDLAAAGCWVVSGFARGIDASAHEGALAGGGPTLAVLPSGLDAPAPGGQASLAGRIAANGALASEVAAGPPFGPGAFVRRNRLIAAIAGATVVVEAADRSGALHTAAFARALGRPCLAVPGDVDRPTALGTLALLRDGARACGDAGDALAALERAYGDAAHGEEPDARLIAALADSPRPLESLAEAAALASDEALARLLRLEWAGLAEARPGGRWARRGGRA